MLVVGLAGGIDSDIASTRSVSDYLFIWLACSNAGWQYRAQLYLSPGYLTCCSTYSISIIFTLPLTDLLSEILHQKSYQNARFRLSVHSSVAVWWSNAGGDE